VEGFRPCNEEASQPGANVELYKKINDLVDSDIPAKLEEAFNLALTESSDAVCLGLAAFIIDPNTENCVYPHKDAVRANDLV
jgi:hypothetical protein